MTTPKPDMVYEHGETVLNELAAAFAEAGISEWWVDFGTLLGVVRAEDFLRADSDIDVSVRAQDLSGLSEVYQARGWPSLWMRGPAGACNGLGWRPHGVLVGLHVWHVGATGTVEHWDNKRKLVYPVHLTQRLEQRKLRDIPVLVPTPPEAYLEWTYGEDWRTPKKWAGSPDRAEALKRWNVEL